MQSVKDYTMDILAGQNPVAEMLKEAGAKTHLLGFGYILVAVDEMDANPDAPITKMGGIYWTVAERFGTNVPKVERAIRHFAEEVMNSPYGVEVLRDNGIQIFPNNGKLTNKELILQLVALKRRKQNEVDQGNQSR